MRISLIIVSLIATSSLLLNIMLLTGFKFSNSPTFKVLEVIDGDTFKIKSGNEERRVRLMGVNTPEAGKCLSLEAKEKLSNLVLSKDVALENQFTDPYGRIMANVYLNGEYINKEMLMSGFARMDYYENPKRDELKKAYEEARLKKVGLFSDVCVSKTSAVKSASGIVCTIKGNIDDNTQKKFYYLASCKNYSQVMIDLSTDDSWFCIEQDAVKAGFAKSKTCE